MIFTNTKKFGGNFRKVLDDEFSVAKNVTIASGYASLDIIEKFEDKFIKIAQSGGTSKLLLGMAFYEGLRQKKLDAINQLHRELAKFNNSSGVYVTNGRRYHGKVYHFQTESSSHVYVGSSNFSSSGTKGNIECTVPIIPQKQQDVMIRFLADLYSPDFSITVDRANITVIGKPKLKKTTIERRFEDLKRYDITKTNRSGLQMFEFPLTRVAEKEKSNLNVYFGKGRLNRQTNIVTPRPWYEIELIASNDLNSQPNYPRGDFLAYTDDGYIIPMSTQGDYHKNIRSKGSLQIFGMWLKGKLEKSGALNKYEPVTLETLQDYGNTSLSFFKFAEGKYYMDF